ncbi:hypothetical protein OHA72_34695 [Dactylosporangium sp. NBC_01737]|uniref:hypothetical protein n=1 Tax=Dactylosporangium sp. NBC_01737 TaxID=2975959 RepID=UPI002E0E2483|nr:hypothetical protein OHA72_34695 [Dactylosporangium sp. NBC_01737]
MPTVVRSTTNESFCPAKPPERSSTILVAEPNGTGVAAAGVAGVTAAKPQTASSVTMPLRAMLRPMTSPVSGVAVDASSPKDTT